MDQERLPGAAFAPADIGWLDFETRSGVDIKVGSYRYATDAQAGAIVGAFAIGNSYASTITNDSRRIAWTHTPVEFRRHHARVIAGEAIWAAWNAGFDKAIWNYATDFPALEAHHIIDVMAQATAAGLPPDLDQAAKVVGTDLKNKSGKALIRLFCLPGSTATRESHPAEWLAFKEYAEDDIAAMRAVFHATKPLAPAEWLEYWAMERVNERGVFIDEKMVAAAARLADEDKVRSRVELARLTQGNVTSVDQVAKLQTWLLAQLPPEAREILRKREQEVDEDGIITRPAKYALTRGQVERLIAFLGAMAAKSPQLTPVLRALQIRLYGGSKTPAKFGKMLTQAVDGVLHGQYVFNGAAQTGRASSRGVQIHNLARDTLPYEHEAIEALLGGAKYDAFSHLGDDSPVSRKLSLLIRPAFVPGGNDRTFVWSDWSQIEARILPWLVGDVDGALERLNVFVAVDRDKRVPDIYTRTAAALSEVPIDSVTKAMRQRGKVAELALGFGGGVGALLKMAAGYGLHLDEIDARCTVTSWRATNPWCVAFWYDLQTAVDCALNDPGQFYYAGRIAYLYDAGYLGGSLLCVLPSYRILTYRAIRYDRVDVLDEDDQPTGKKENRLRFARGYGRVNLWHGMLCENVVQAVAADCLRGTLRRLEQEGFTTRLHTHDECVVECVDDNAVYTAKRLRETMRRGFEWSQGLPLMSEETISWYYTKQEN